MRQMLAVILFMMILFSSCNNDQKREGEVSNEIAEKYYSLYQKHYQLKNSGATQADLNAIQKEMDEICASVNPLEKYDPMIEFSGVRFMRSTQYPKGEDRFENRWMDVYRERLGIDLKWKWITETWDTYMQKMNIMIATGELPEFGEAEQENMNKLWKAQKVSNMMPYMPWLKKEVREALFQHPVAMEVAKNQDALTSLPELRYPEPKCLWIRNDWLKKFGLSKPKNIKQLREIMRQFRFNDPDGNGKDDTIGMGLDSNSMSAKLFYHGFNSYPFHNIWVRNEKDNSLVYGTVTNETKQALTELRSMIEEGLMDQEWSIMTKSMIDEDIIASRLGVKFGAHWNPIFPLEKNIMENPEAEWVWADMPKKGGGIAKDAIDINPANFFWTSNYTRHPEALFKMASLNYELLSSENQELEYHTDMESDIQVFFYAFCNIKVNTRNGNAGIAKMIKEAIETDQKFEGHGLLPIDKKYFDGCMKYLSGDLSGWAMWKTFGPESFNYRMNWYLENKHYRLNDYFGPVLGAWVDKGMTLEKFRDEKFVEFLTGDRSLDEWQRAFVDKWYELGGQDATDEANQWWEDRR